MDKFVKPRPQFPKKAVVTSGMPYGNKLLHFGHLGMILRADVFARFLRDRIGKDNVIYVSGTDCYGSPVIEAYRKLQEEGKCKDKSMLDYVIENHNKQKEVLDRFEVSFNLYGGSAIGRASEIHKDVSKWFIEKLYQNGMVSKHSSYQFYDTKHKCLLNGRQVVGKCPIDNCQSEKGYADECDLGHQYLPQDLIDPVSTLSGEKPVLVKVENLYFNLENCTEILNEWINSIDRKSDTPQFMVKEIREFFKKPEIYIKREYFDEFDKVKDTLPPFTEIERGEKAPRTIVFDKLEDRESACEILAKHSIRYRTGKTLTPFRLTGNIDWGVPCPTIDGIEGQTFYVWPESLWAPISFTKTYLESKGFDENEWQKYWADPDAQVNQFLGEDNLYFYGPAQQAMWLYTQGAHPLLNPEKGQLQLTKINPIKSILYMNKKASSSGSVKPPMANEFLEHYTAEQIRMHFLAMNLANNNVSLSPKAFDSEASDDEIDPVVKEGNLLTNVYNRILRTVFYSTQAHFDGVLPRSSIDASTMEECKKAILDVERFMYDKKFHQVFNALDVFIRNINKYWVKEINNCVTEEKLGHLTANTMQMIFVANTLLHPIAPSGTENVADYIGFNKDLCFDWANIFGKYESVLDRSRGGTLKELKPKEDFFKRHQSQLDELAKKNQA